MRLFLNGLAASAGGGLTYLRNVIPQLSSRSEVEITVAVPLPLRDELDHFQNIRFVDVKPPAGTARRFWWEQTALSRIIERNAADVLISAGNFALRSSPIPQILLSRNSLYTSPDFFRDLRQRDEYAMWIDGRFKALLAKQSIHWADCTIAPSQAFADELQRWTGKPISVIHHGFDSETFFRDNSPLPPGIERQLAEGQSCLRLLFVSHYNYYRNFETLLRALPMLKKKLGHRNIKLFLTCKLAENQNPGSYRTQVASRLIEQLRIGDSVVQLGSIPYNLLHYVYKACDVYVTPAYTETFAHPLVEAMASGLPVVASDLPVHREICGDAALYFPKFSPDDMAEQLCLISNSARLVRTNAELGRARALRFSWSEHVTQLLDKAESLSS